MDFTVRNVPDDLLADFDKKVVDKKFPGGRSQAIRDLMRKAIQEHTS